MNIAFFGEILDDELYVPVDLIHNWVRNYFNNVRMLLATSSKVCSEHCVSNND